MYTHMSECVQVFACACVCVRMRMRACILCIFYICTTYTYIKGQEREKGSSHDLDKRGEKTTNVLRLTFDGAGKRFVFLTMDVERQKGRERKRGEGGREGKGREGGREVGREKESKRDR
jgi:hypothetical protein